MSKTALRFSYYQPPPPPLPPPPPPPSPHFPPLQPPSRPVAPPPLPPHVQPPQPQPQPQPPQPQPQPHPIPPPPPHVHPPPHPLPPPLPPSPDHHPTVIIIVIVSCGGLFLLAFMAVALLCCLKKRKKKRTQEEIDILHFDEHRKVREEIRKGPHGTEAVVITVEDDVHIDGDIVKTSGREKLGNSQDGIGEGGNETGESSSNVATAVVPTKPDQLISVQHEHHQHQPVEHTTTN